MSAGSKVLVKPIVVAGAVVRNPLAVVLDYLGDRHQTVRKYDGAAGSSETISQALLDATRGPWQMNSRISHSEGDWLLERSRTAPWANVPKDASLVDADPMVDGELFDDAETLWQHFWRVLPRGVAITKLSMILHLTRPSLIPILDNRLITLYTDSVKVMRVELRERSNFTDPEVMVWTAIRKDLITGSDSIVALRESLRSNDSDFVRGAIETISDLRMMDILGKSLI